MNKKLQNIEKLFELKRRFDEVRHRIRKHYLVCMLFIVPVFFLPALGFPLVVLSSLFSVPLFIISSFVLASSFVACLAIFMISTLSYIRAKEDLKKIKEDLDNGHC